MKSGNEAFHQWLLEVERMARTKGTDPSDHKYYDDRYECLWALLDYQPTDGVSNDTIKETIDQHLLSMQATYEVTSDDHLTFEDAMEYSLDRKNKQWARFTEKMTDATRNRIFATTSTSVTE